MLGEKKGEKVKNLKERVTKVKFDLTKQDDSELVKKRVANGDSQLPPVNGNKMPTKGLLKKKNAQPTTPATNGKPAEVVGKKKARLQLDLSASDGEDDEDDIAKHIYSDDDEDDAKERGFSFDDVPGEMDFDEDDDDDDDDEEVADEFDEDDESGEEEEDDEDEEDEEEEEEEDEMDEDDESEKPKGAKKLAKRQKADEDDDSDLGEETGEAEGDDKEVMLNAGLSRAGSYQL